MIVLDTSVLVDGLAGTKWLNAALRGALDRGERLLVPSLVLYEWLRGPRLPEELAAQEALLPRELALHFGPREAALAAELYRTVSRPRGREHDLAIAAHAITLDAELWTSNLRDFRDIPALRLTTSR